MTNELVIVTNVLSREITGLDVVNSVNGFYSSAFNQTLWLLGVLIALLGIVVPVAYYFLQKRQLVLKEQRMAEKLKSEVNLHAEALKKIIEESLVAERAINTERFTKLENELKIEAAEANGGIFHIQGNSQCNGGYHLLAINSYAAAINNYLDSGNLRCVQQMIQIIIDQNLPKMEKGDFEDPDAVEIIGRLNAALASAANVHCNGLLDESIAKLKKDLATAQKRKV